ncbi:MAG: TMEM175 family protein [Fimbriimonadaceae bacterium]
MTKTRLEAFSDAVIAIIMTIMVLELRPPDEATVEALKPLLPKLSSYLLSFVFLGIYWNNHHHMLHGTRQIGGAVLWANLHLLFWLSLVPFTTAWMGETGFAAYPVALYGVVLPLCAIAYTILTLTIVRAEGEGSAVAAAIGKDVKGKVSILIYAISVPLAIVSPYLAGGLYVLVALMWLVPDRRFERR